MSVTLWCGGSESGLETHCDVVRDGDGRRALAAVRWQTALAAVRWQMAVGRALRMG